MREWDDICILIQKMIMVLSPFSGDLYTLILKSVSLATAPPKSWLLLDGKKEGFRVKIIALKLLTALPNQGTLLMHAYHCFKLQVSTSVTDMCSCIPC